MTERIEKKKQLDDEMTRFEAEILGPGGDISPIPPPPIPPGIKTIIGTNTFNKSQQQLKQTNDPPSLQPPPGPPDFNLIPMDGPPRPFLPPENVSPGFFRHPENNAPRPFRHPENTAPRPFRYQENNNAPRPFRPPEMFPRGIRPMENGPRPFPQNFGPSLIGPMGPRPPPFMGQPNRPMGPGPQFMGNGEGPPPRFHPPPPPGFIPPQVIRPPCGPMMPGVPMPPRQMGFVNPPPPPPNLLMGEGKPGIILKAAIISSAPKLYNKEPTKEIVEKKTTVSSADVLPPFETKKKKVKVEAEIQSVATEMAEKVKLSTTTTKFTPKTSSDDKKKDKKSKKNLRYAGGQVWEDSTLGEWDHGDFRLFAGDLGSDVTDELLNRYFSHYPSFLKAKVIRDKRTNKSKGYGFISFRDSQDYIKAMKEINGKYVGSRPIKLRKSMWRDRSFDVVQKKIKEKQIIGLK